MDSQMKKYIRQGLEESAAQELCPCGGGMHHPPGMWTCSPTQKFSELHTLGIYMEASSHRHDQLLSQSLAPLLFQERKDGTESSKLLITAWFFW